MNRLAPCLAPCLALFAACPAFAAEIVIQQVGLSFSPSSVTVNVGDTVRWVRTSGSHTVTSGSNCTSNGLFSAPLNSTFTSFAWVVPESTAGTTVRYFCSPHCSSMTGTIVVRPLAIPGDLNGDGAVNGADLGILLSGWAQPGPTDLNNDGTTDGLDLGILLSRWTS